MNRSLRLVSMFHVVVLVASCTESTPIGEPPLPPPLGSFASLEDAGGDATVPSVPYPTEKLTQIERSVTRMIRAGDLAFVGEVSSRDAFGNRLSDGRVWTLDGSGNIALFDEGYADPYPVGADATHVYFLAYSTGVSSSSATVFRKPHHGEGDAESLFTVTSANVFVQEGFLLSWLGHQVHRVATSPGATPELLTESETLAPVSALIADDVLYVSSFGTHAIPLNGGEATHWPMDELGTLLGVVGGELIKSGALLEGREVHAINRVSGARRVIGGLTTGDYGCVVADLHAEDDALYWLSRNVDEQAALGRTTISTGEFVSWSEDSGLLEVDSDVGIGCPMYMVVVGDRIYSVHGRSDGLHSVHEVYVTPVPTMADAGT